MKQLISISLLFIFCLIYNANLFAQENEQMRTIVEQKSFQKGDLIFAFSVGFGNSSITQTYITAEFVPGEGLSYPMGLPQTARNAIFTLPFNIEYAISNKFGVGLDVRYTDYSFEMFTYSGGFIATPEFDPHFLDSGMTTIDIGPSINYHLITTKKSDFYIGIGLGYTKIKSAGIIKGDKYFSSYGDDFYQAQGAGFYWKFNVNYRLFVFKNLGIKAHLDYTGSRSNLDGELTPIGQNNYSYKNFDKNINMVTHGIYFGLGLALKF